MGMTQRTGFLRLAYVAAIAVKGLDGAAETVAGMLVAVLGTASLSDYLLRTTAPELDLHPASRAIHLVRHGAQTLSQSHGGFIAVWLLIHGVLKLVLAVELLRGKSWIFPVASAILAAFIAYMTWRLTHHWSLWLLAFALFDVFTLALVLHEWYTRRMH
ncbi:MAG TPA: DUF2127 domain-containing protein [Rhizomicrobium sp.]|jgi:uncharacterized membrane protein